MQLNPFPYNRHKAIAAKRGRTVIIFQILLTALLVTGLTGTAVSKAPAQSEGDNRSWPHKSSDLSPSPKLTFGTLENGIRYVLMQNQKPKDRVSMHLNVSAGAYHEAPDERGIAHFLEHMLFNGTEHFKAGELVKYFQRIGMQFGPDVNARTGFYETVYDLDLPDGDRDSLSEGLLVLRDYAAGALIAADEVKQERGVILSEKRSRDSPDYRTFEATLAFELPDARISKRLPIGTEEVIRKTDRKLLKGFYDTWYRPDRLTVVMAGQFDKKTAKKLIEKRFADISARAPEKPEPDFGTIDHEGLQPFYHHESEAGSTRVVIETLRKHPLPDDSKAYQREKMRHRMADRIVQHRLNEALNSGDAPFTEAQISSGNFLRFIRATEIKAQCPKENWEKSLAALEQTLRKALHFGFTESEVKRVKKEFSARLERAVKSASTRESSTLTRQIMSHLNRDRVFQSPAQRQKLLAPAIESATAESLHKRLKDDWAPEHRLLIVTGNAEIDPANDAPEDQIVSTYNKSRQTAVKKPEESKDLTFPYLAAPQTPGKIKSRKDFDDQGITRVVFENGTTLFVKQTDFEADQVKAAVSFGAGESVEPADQAGLSELSQQVVNLSGLGKLDRDQLKQVLAGKDTSVNFAVEEDKFVFQGETVTDETRLLFELFYAHLMDPAFRKTAYKLATKQFTQKYQSLGHSIEGAMQLEGSRFLAGGDPRFGLPALETLKQTRLADIREWITGAMENSPIEIAVVGDMEPDRIIELAATFFGTIAERSDISEPEKERHPDFPENKSTNIDVPTRIDKGLVLVAYPTTDIWNIDHTRQLSILSQVVSDRMRIKIREQMGAAYSQAAYNKPGRAYPDWGIFNAYAVIDPEDAGAVKQALKEIAADLNKNGATEDEVKRAVQPVLTDIKESLKTNNYWLNTVLKGASRHPVQIEWNRSIQSDYKSITPQDINKMADMYLENAAAATVFIYPEEKQTEDAGNKAGAEGSGS
ncbi:MAG: M16 family metallopeptidase [Thermodesulfobacteriota bacterium]